MAEPADPHSKGPLSGLLSIGDLIVHAPRELAAANDGFAARLLQITAAIADAVSAEAVHAALVDHLSVALSASTCGLWLREGEFLRLVRQVGYAPRAQEALRELPVQSQVSLPILDAVRRAEPIFVSSQRALIEAYPHAEESATKGRAYRITCLPLVVDGAAFGVLAITFDEEREATPGEQSLLLLVARYATHALERLRILDAERRSRQRADAVARRMTILSHASRAFSEAHVEHDQRLQNIVQEVGTLMGASATISLVQSDGALHHVANYNPIPAAQAMIREITRGVPQDLAQGMLGQVVRSGTSVFVSSGDPAVLSSRAPEAYREFFERFPVYAVMVVALRVHGRSIGSISASRVKPGETFDADDLELLEGLAERAATAIENSRLHRDAEEARRRAEQLYIFANEAVRADTLDAVFEAALSAIIDALEADRASILLFDDGDVMRFKASRGLSEDYRRAVDGHSPWKRDDRSPSPLFVANCLEDPAWASYEPAFRREGIAALSFIPLMSRGELLGKFMVYYDEPHAFDARDIEVSRAIANHLASMIARFRAVAELERTIRDNEMLAGVLAHDLRNPLSAIMTAAQLALMHHEGEHEGAGERAAKPLSRIVSSTERMSNMITQLLDFTRARVGGGIEIHRCMTSLLDVTTQAVAELELAYPSRTFDIETAGDHHGNWDPDRLLQIASNLLGNACQHGEASSPIKITLDGRAADAVVLSIHNRGTVPPTLLPRIFEPFRGQQRRQTNARGLGLGLYIVREIARAHHGTVDVESAEHTGTTFVVRLPRG